MAWIPVIPGFCTQNDNGSLLVKLVLYTENQLSGAKPDFECLWAVHFYKEKFELLFLFHSVAGCKTIPTIYDMCRSESIRYIR